MNILNCSEMKFSSILFLFLLQVGVENHLYGQTLSSISPSPPSLVSGILVDDITDWQTVVDSPSYFRSDVRILAIYKAQIKEPYAPFSYSVGKINGKILTWLTPDKCLPSIDSRISRINLSTLPDSIMKNWTRLSL